MQHHVIDPTYFYDAIAEFAFDYEIFTIDTFTIDEYGNRQESFTKRTINGSLQTQGKKRRQSKSGNTDELQYMFYCKSLYRIDIGDYIRYKHNWLYVDDVHDYDEWGVREAHLTMVQTTGYKNLDDYDDYINGGKLV